VSLGHILPVAVARVIGSRRLSGFMLQLHGAGRGVLPPVDTAVRVTATRVLVIRSLVSAVVVVAVLGLTLGGTRVPRPLVQNGLTGLQGEGL